MLIVEGRVSDLLANEACLETPDHLLHWRGFVHLPGVAPGAASLAACRWDGIDDVRRAACSLRGSFVLSVISRADGRHHVFVGGLLDAFISGATVSSSFLRLCEVLGLRFGDVDPEAVAEFVDLGFVLGRRTFVAGVERMVPGRIYELTGGRAVHHDGGPPGIEAPPEPGLTVEGYFRELSDSLKGLRVSSDLTGGSDSRMVAALLARELDVEFAITGMPGNSDIEIARAVAAALDSPLYVLEHRVDQLADEIPELFEALDGLGDILGHHRAFQNALARRSRQVRVALSGAGGELYKDFWWLQDFPRYRSSRSNVERLLDLRVRPVAVPEGLLAGRFADAAVGVRERTLDLFRACEMPLNTQTYDRIYYDIKMGNTTARYTSMNAGYVPSFTPLLAPELVRLGFALPRRDRFFNRFHRRVVSRAAPEVSTIRTTEGGITLSGDRVRQLAEMGPYAREKARRLVGKVRQRAAGADLRQESPDHVDLVPTARELPVFGLCVERLRECGVLHPQDVPDAYVGRILTLGLFATRVGMA
jgi:hypothetical protein